MMASYDEVDSSIKPKDSLDECYYDHDQGYQSAIKKEKNGMLRAEMYKMWLEADKKLVENITALSLNPREWEHPPIDHSVAYTRFYRTVSKYVFTLKIKLHDLMHN